MSCEDDAKERRASPFPNQMQGAWVGKEELDFEVTINRAEVVWNKSQLEYLDKFEQRYEDGVIAVQILVPYRMDSGDDINLVTWPEGEMHAFNDHFAINLVRAEPDGRLAAQI